LWLTWDNNAKLAQNDESVNQEEQELGPVVLLQWHQWLFDHHTFHVSWLFQHLLEFKAMIVFDRVGNEVSACEAGLVGGLAAGTAEEERAHRPDGLQCCNTLNGEM
jgi:hypothetical protein